MSIKYLFNSKSCYLPLVHSFKGTYLVNKKNNSDIKLVYNRLRKYAITLTILFRVSFMLGISFNISSLVCIVLLSASKKKGSQ